MRRILLAASVLFAAMLGAAQAQLLPQRQMVSAANPHAVQAGLEILDAGGSALDAAIAVQMVLGLVEPQSSGIGGGAFILYWDAQEQKVYAYDGRETAPASVTPDIFLKDDGAPEDFLEAVVGGRSVGVPGVVDVYWLAHERHGKLDWARNFTPAIRLAQGGFEISPRLHKMLGWSPVLNTLPKAQQLYFRPKADGEGYEPLPVGTRFTNRAYADTLRIVAAAGPDGFYKGPVASAILTAVNRAPSHAGNMTQEDLDAYEAKEREAICRSYRDKRVCVMPPPTSGGVTVLQILGMLEQFDMAALAPNSVEAIHLITEASRLAYADRNMYLADPDFVNIPVEGLLDPDYLAARAQLIDPATSMGTAEAGTPSVNVKPKPRKKIDIDDDEQALLFGPNIALDFPSTSHFSIIDNDGNVASVTTSIEAPFGSHQIAAGFFLNNQLTDFSFVPEVDGKPVANAPAGGKRPRSSMSPTIVFNEGGGLFGTNDDFFAAVGSPGGSRIIAYVTQTLVALIDWDMSMQDSISLPRHVNRNGPLELEANTGLVEKKEALEALGHEVRITDLVSGLHGIKLKSTFFEGGADPRREGVARGR